MVDWTDGNAAAWAQAILSGLAILYSGRLAANQARTAKRERVDTYIQIVTIAMQEAQHAEELLTDALKSGSAINGSPYGFLELKKDLESAPFHEVPDHRLVRILRDAAEACKDLHENCDKLLNSSIAISAINLVEVQYAEELLYECHKQSIEIMVELHSIPGRIWLEIKIEARRAIDWIKRHVGARKNPED